MKTKKTTRPLKPPLKPFPVSLINIKIGDQFFKFNMKTQDSLPALSPCFAIAPDCKVCLDPDVPDVNATNAHYYS